MQETEADFMIKKELTVKEVDDTIKRIVELRADKKVIKEAMDAVDTELDVQESKLIKMLEEAGKTAYIAEGFGKVKISYIMTVQTPKSTEDKLAFFTWLEQNKGKDIADAYITVNSQALNSLYNELSEEFASRGEVLQIDGISEPLTRTKLSITKA